MIRAFGRPRLAAEEVLELNLRRPRLRELDECGRGNVGYWLLPEGSRIRDRGSST